MINKFKALDNIGLISYLHKLVLAIRQFFATKSETDVVATALTDLDTRKVDVSDLVDYKVTVTEQGEQDNTLKSYVISQGGSVIGTISIPKDLIVSSGSVVVGDWVDGVFTENASGTGKAIKLVISNQSEPIYINVQDLANVYTAQQGATEIQLAISNTNEISATLVKSVRDKIDNAITTSNYNSYSPTLTGSGAFGTWGIDISGNADTSDYAKYLRGRDPNGNYYEPESVNCNIIAEWNTKSDNRWYLKSNLSQCRVGYADNAENADKVNWSGIENKPADTIGDATLVVQVNGTKIIPTGGDFTANKSGVPSIFNIPVPTADSIKNSVITSTDFASAVSQYIGNGRLILKNGNDIISDTFTANKGDDTTINLNFTNKSDFELLGSKVDKIDTSIAELNTALQVENPIDDSDEGNEETIESNNEPFTKQIGIIRLRFWNITTYTDLPVYDVWVNHVADVIEPFGSVSYCYDIFLVTGITDSIVSSVGLTSDSYKPFFIRGANSNNKVCEKFDVRGNGNINTARATIIGGYMHLQCRLKLHGGDSGTGNYIMEKVKNENFSAQLCLRQTP